jgi:hypothetical protein
VVNSVPVFKTLVVGNADWRRTLIFLGLGTANNMISVPTGLRVTLNPFPIHQTDSSGRLFGHLTLVDLS